MGGDAVSDPRDTVARVDVARAAVTVGAVETSYVRVGSGPVVVLLDERAGEAEVSALAPLTARARCIVPDRTTIFALSAPGHVGETPFGRWLGGFLEGLGIYDVSIVAPSFLGGELRRFVESHRGVVSCIVLRGAYAGRPFPSDVTVRVVAHDAPWDAVAAALGAPAAPPSARG
jgi:hypothetical protein